MGFPCIFMVLSLVVISVRQLITQQGNLAFVKTTKNHTPPVHACMHC